MADGADIVVKFANITLLNSTWKIHGLNLIVTKANLVKTQFYMEKRFKCKQSKFIKVLNSTYGSLFTSNGYEITISNSNIDGTTRLKKTLLGITKCSLTIINSIFYKLISDTGPAMINAVKSWITMQDVTISDSKDITVNKRNPLSTALVHIERKSNITLSSCRFTRNTMSSHLISVSYSDITITECQFTRNTVSSANRIIEAEYCNVTISDSHFIGNIAQILAIKQGVINVQGSTFIRNNVQDDLIAVESSNGANFANSVFTGNIVGTVLDATSENIFPSSYLQLHSSSFKNNQIRLHAASAVNIADVIIDQVSALFCSNLTKCHGMSVTNVQTVRIRNSMFRGGILSQFDFNCNNFVSCSTELFTIQSNFSNTDKCLTTNTTDFLSEAESTGFIFKGVDCTLGQQETKYASGKLRINSTCNIKLILDILHCERI